MVKKRLSNQVLSTLDRKIGTLYSGVLCEKVKKLREHVENLAIFDSLCEEFISEPRLLLLSLMVCVSLSRCRVGGSTRSIL